jgi:predicted phage terminase large subunit-like protein
MSRVPVSAMSFIPRLSPRYTAPEHLAPLVAMFERIARGEEVDGVVCVPPGHEKTETILHLIVWLMKHRPTLRVCYASHGQRIAEKKSRRALQLAERARLALDKSAMSRADWRLRAVDGAEAGGLWATSRTGAVIGERFDLIVEDDVVRDRVDAESARAREQAWEWHTDTMGSRLEPHGSRIAVGHRWHADDLPGRLIKAGAEAVVLPALNDRGEALLPSRFSVAQLERIRVRMGDYGFDGLYLQRPPARGGYVFNDVQTYSALPTGLTIAIGADFAYSIRTHADCSVAVVLGTDGERWYVIEVSRLRVAAPQFQAELERLRAKYTGAEIVSYIGGTERGVIDMMQAQGLDVHAQPARGDKFTRSQPVAAAWNAGKVLVPDAQHVWRNPFVTEVCGFTGVGDRHDDQVDALAAAFDALRGASVDDGETLIGGGSDRGASRARNEKHDPFLLEHIRANARRYGFSN